MVDDIAVSNGGNLFGFGVNSFGEVVGDGTVDGPGTPTVAYIFSDSLGVRKLNDLIDPASGWNLTQALGIDDNGDVVGTGFLNGRFSAYLLRLPLRPASGGAPTVAVAHTYGYDGLRTSTTNGPGSSSASVQFWFTQDYTQHDGAREHYVRIGDRIVAKVTYNPPPGGMTGMGMAGMGLGAVLRPGEQSADPGDLIAKGVLALMLLGGAGVSVAGFVGKRRRPAWVAATAGPVALFFVASCEMLGLDSRRSAQTLWQRVQTVYFHKGIGPGPVLTTNSDGSMREERTYEPFGQPIQANTGTLGPVDFRREEENSLGKLTDPATGWSYHGARWMQPQTARWTVPDPALKGPGSSSLTSIGRFNPYQYVLGNPNLFWDPEGSKDESLPSSTSASQFILAPNFDLGAREQWHYTKNEIVINTLPQGISQDTAIGMVRGELRTFASLNYNGNNIATVDILPTGIARFHLDNLKGMGSPAINDAKIMVQLSTFTDPKLGTVQIAYTLANHALQGIRVWYATKDPNGGIDIITKAYEIPNGILNATIGGLLGSSRDQKALWNTFLRNIDAKDFGGQGNILPMQEKTTQDMINPMATPLGCTSACAAQPWNAEPQSAPTSPLDPQ